VRLISVGSVVIDVVAAVGSLPARGGDVFASDVAMSAGGGFNAMAAAARQGLRVLYAGAVGTGPLGDLARGALAAEGIEVLLPPRPDRDTGLVVGLVDAGGERTFVSGRGAETTLTGADLRDLHPSAGDAVLVSGYGLLQPDAPVSWIRALPDEVLVVLDPGPLAAAADLARVRERADWISANAAEATALSGCSDPADAAAALRGRVGAVVRTGPGGCVVACPEPVRVPGFAVTAIDTNGAGDTHTGVFLAGMVVGDSPVAAARRANAAAALSITRRGPATSPTEEELQAFLRTSAPPGPQRPWRSSPPCASTER
jgi:sugar/nucleoside kinase (ribokinase family)